MSCNALCEVQHGRFGASASRHLASANVHQSVEECSGCYYYRLGAERHAPHRLYTHSLAILHKQLAGFVLPDVKAVDTVET